MKIIQLLFLAFTLMSCDVMYRVTIRNYGDPKEVKVTCKKGADYYLDSDSIYVYNIGTRDLIEKVKITAIDSSSYTVQVLTETDVVLLPLRINAYTINSVELELTKDSIWMLYPFDNKPQMKELKKKGLVKGSFGNYKILLK
ncbi:hypothetical protein [Flammeovirga sp. SJP92]|uniref:hypothetical protein n=1 Tax=Flammeovirga sp. SJP92 TaxID=1775430 RepID=UPI0012F828D4|nr:hypothetical protein [Flammeovirga sp. SJP92]